MVTTYFVHHLRHTIELHAELLCAMVLAVRWVKLGAFLAMMTLTVDDVDDDLNFLMTNNVLWEQRKKFNKIVKKTINYYLLSFSSFFPPAPLISMPFFFGFRFRV